MQDLTPVRTFIQQRQPQLCVLSSVSPLGASNSAVMGYLLLDDFSVIVSTHTTSRKWQNIQKNPRVSLIFGWSFQELNVQYEGIASLVDTDPEKSKIEEIYFKANPAAAKFKGEDSAYIKISPVWMKTTDSTQHPPKIEEHAFGA